MTRSVTRILDSQRTVEGGGFVVRRPFPTRTLDSFDPFLLLDEMGPVDYAPGEAVGAPDHPHRGFETVTYMLEGTFEHKDSRGHSGAISAGDVQWMTAGSGVVHSEMPSVEIRRDGGKIHGFQLWVNLPRIDKMMTPRYQEVPGNSIPHVESDGVSVRVIAGEAMGASAVIDTRTPIIYLHYTLSPGTRVEQPVSAGLEVFAYIVSGAGTFGHEQSPAGEGQMVIFASDGDSVSFQADPKQTLELLLLGGVPLREPIARYGPFVMNTQGEILQAMADYQSGKMGGIDF